MSPVDANASWYDFSTLSQLKANAATNPAAKREEVVSQFESLFLGLMIKEMRKAIPNASLLDSSSVQTYQQMLDQQLAVGLAKAGGIGLGRFLEESFHPPTKPHGQNGNETTALLPIEDTLAVLNSRGIPVAKDSAAYAIPMKKKTW